MTIKSQLQIPCPLCQQSDRTILMEDLYFTIIESDKPTLSELNLDGSQANKLLREIKPPSMDHLPFWLIVKPDILVSILLVIMVILTALFAQPSRQSFLNNLILPAVLVVTYLLFRKNINQSVLKVKINRESELRKAQIAADRWSSFFVCLRDQVVFSGHNKINFPIGETQERMFSDFAVLEKKDQIK